MKIISFGEILFDVFVHASVIGGAPFNFISHAVAQGAQGYLVCSVGDDELGKEAVSEMKRRKVNTDLVTRSPLPTGRCLVTLDACGVPSYDLIEGAYDETYLPTAAKEIVRGGYDALYFGTLAQRGEKAKMALYELVSLGGYKEVFYDINIRQSYYSKDIIEDSLRIATILKVSREEAHVFSELGISNERGEALCRDLAQKYGLRQVIMTLDSDGAFVYDKNSDKFTHSERPRARVVSTVGAGDSFSATYLVSYLKGEKTEISVAKAVAVSSFVVEHAETIPEYTKKLCEFLR